MANTKRFMSELHTSEEVQRVAKEHGTTLTLEQAHECWCEHSDDYCAGWLVWRDANATGEILQSLTKYLTRHSHVPKFGHEVLTCPWCKEAEFDEVGLKLHITNGECDSYNALSTSLPRTVNVKCEP